jgi:SAM-dependent methyltransferase
MPRTGELTYYDQIGQSGQQHAVAKPFSTPECASYLFRVGALMSLLPAPPARVLECGCGTGWLAYFLAKRGYDVVATDVSPAAIRLAQTNPMFHSGLKPEFLVADAEKLPFAAEFEAAIFFDALHHAVDELAALQCAWRALRPGGICVMVEPGWGHHEKSRGIEETHQVTEKDMPPCYLRRMGKKAGFKGCKIYPAPHHLCKTLFPALGTQQEWPWRLLTFGPLKYFTALTLMVLYKRYNGLTVLVKGN